MSGLPQEKREKLKLMQGGAEDKKDGKGKRGGGGGSGGGKEDKEDKLPVADRLLALVDQHDPKPELVCDQFGMPYVIWEGQPIALDASFDPYLRLLMMEAEKRSVGKDALAQARDTLAAKAHIDGEERELHVRSAFYEGSVYFRLSRGRVWRIDRDGFREVSDPPVLFRNVRNLQDLPDPTQTGSFRALGEWVNLKGERDKRMFVVWLVTALLPHVPRPMLEATGPEGAGKSTMSRVAKRVVDPSKPESIRFDDDFLQKASHCYVVMLDNTRHMPNAASDILCRLVTGEADSKRSLYTNDDDFIYEMRRSIILNGINNPLDQADARDRALPVELERIEEYKAEEDLWEEFDAERPELLGAMFATLAAAMRIRPFLERPRKVRLADWASYANAIYVVLGWGEEQFTHDWAGVKDAQVQGTVDASPIAQAIIAYMEGKPNWEGAATALHEALENVAESLNLDPKRNKAWPATPSWMWRRINSVRPTLEALGLKANRQRPAQGTWITIDRVEPPGADARNPQDGHGSNRGSNRGSSDPFAAIPAAIEDLAYLWASGSTGSTGSKLQDSTGVTPCSSEKTGDRTAKTGGKEHSDHLVDEQDKLSPANAAIAASAASEGSEDGWIEGEDPAHELHLIGPPPEEDAAAAADIDELREQLRELEEEERRGRGEGRS
ncbi:MAG: hypothetical protein M3P49_13730 [Actinomycetota bacterium]|nr:hypothetical protein [Actinomycetota bacterium]